MKKARDNNHHRAFFHGMAFLMQLIEESAELSYKHTTYLNICSMFVQK